MELTIQGGKATTNTCLLLGLAGPSGAQAWQGWFLCSLQEQQALPTAPYIHLAVTERLYPAPADTPWAGLEAHSTGQGDPVTLLYNFFFFPCTFVLDIPSSFQTRAGYSPGHIFFIVFQAILSFSSIHNLICMGFMGQNSGVVTQRVCGTVNVVPVMCADPAGGLQTCTEGEGGTWGLQRAGSPPNGAIISPL